jgi:transposase
MAQLVQSAGIDCGKRFLDIAVYPGGEQIRLENEPADHQRLVVWLTERGVTRVGLEASGGYERAVRDVLCAAGLESLTRRACAISPRPRGDGPRPTRSTPG